MSTDQIDEIVEETLSGDLSTTEGAAEILQIIDQAPKSEMDHAVSETLDHLQDIKTEENRGVIQKISDQVVIDFNVQTLKSPEPPSAAEEMIQNVVNKTLQKQISLEKASDKIARMISATADPYEITFIVQKTLKNIENQKTHENEAMLDQLNRKILEKFLPQKFGLMEMHDEERPQMMGVPALTPAGVRDLEPLLPTPRSASARSPIPANIPILTPDPMSRYETFAEIFGRVPATTGSIFRRARAGRPGFQKTTPRRMPRRKRLRWAPHPETMSDYSNQAVFKVPIEPIVLSKIKRYVPERFSQKARSEQRTDRFFKNFKLDHRRILCFGEPIEIGKNILICATSKYLSVYLKEPSQTQVHDFVTMVKDWVRQVSGDVKIQNKNNILENIKSKSASDIFKQIAAWLGPGILRLRII